MQLLRSLGQVFIVLKDKIALDLTKNVGQDIARFKALIVYHFNDISRVITELIKFGIQIADVFIQLLENVVNFERKPTTSSSIWTKEKLWIEGLLGVVAAWKTINMVMMASPIGVVLMLIAAIALLIDDYQSWKKGSKSLINWGQWESEINAVKAGLKNFTNFLQNKVWKVAKKDLSDLLDAFKHFWPTLQQYLMPVIDFFGRRFIHTLHYALGTITGIVKLLDDLMNHDFKAAGNDAVEIAANFGGATIGKFTDIAGLIVDEANVYNQKGQSHKELAKGTLLARTTLRDENVPLVQAAALLGNFQQEGSMNPYTVSGPDKHGDLHYGIFQWTPARAEKIKAALGIDVMHPDKDRNKALVDQVRATVWEMRQGQEKNTSRDFWNATNVISASDALNEKVLRSGEIVKGKIVDPTNNDLRRGYAQQALHYDLNPTSEWNQKTEDRWEKEAEENYFKAQGIDQKKFDEMNQKAAQARIAGRQLSIDQSQTSGDTNTQTNEITLYYNGSGSAQDAKAFAKQLNDSLNQQTNTRNFIGRRY